jgi:hypothetical protein
MFGVGYGSAARADPLGDLPDSQIPPQPRQAQIGAEVAKGGLDGERPGRASGRYRPACAFKGA